MTETSTLLIYHSGKITRYYQIPNASPEILCILQDAHDEYAKYGTYYVKTFHRMVSNSNWPEVTQRLIRFRHFDTIFITGTNNEDQNIPKS